MNSALQPQGVFFMFAVFNFIAVAFVYFYVPEIKDLPETEKKKLFYPGAKWGRKLAPGEAPFVDEDENEKEDIVKTTAVMHNHDSIGGTVTTDTSASVISITPKQLRKVAE